MNITKCLTICDRGAYLWTFIMSQQGVEILWRPANTKAKIQQPHQPIILQPAGNSKSKQAGAQLCHAEASLS